MAHRVKPNKQWGILLGLSFAAPAFAHTVKVAGDVAATFHIEPNHNPKVGQPSQAWIALTQRGGKVIPLTKCRCKLKIYLNPYKKGDTPTLEPALRPISTERYQNIPSAEITFPKSGEYRLEISGMPQSGATFQPFELSYEVTVMASPFASKTIAQPKPSPQMGSRDFIGLKVAIAGLSMTGIAVMVYILRRKKQ
jgi:hypothetical protein